MLFLKTNLIVGLNANSGSIKFVTDIMFIGKKKYCRTLPFNLRQNIYTSPSFRSIIRGRRKIERECAYTQ